MTTSIGIPVPDCASRRAAKQMRRAATLRLAEHRGESVTMVNGEETAYDLGYALNFHKSLPHSSTGEVHRESYAAMVRMLSGQEYGAAETLPVGENRSAGATGSPTNPPRYAETFREAAAGAGPTLGYRKLTSPFTGHVFDPEGADAADFAIGPAPLVASDELAAEMAEVYVMALMRDVRFADMNANTLPAGFNMLVNKLGDMPWFKPGTAADPRTAPKRATTSEKRRFNARNPIKKPEDLFRGSTPGAKAGPWVSQFMLAGVDNTGFDFDAGAATKAARITRADGKVLFGTLVIDQCGIVAKEGVDYLCDWGSWLDCQNGVDFNNLDIFQPGRRFLTTPRDIATYVHFDALYQAYLVACLTMLADGKAFPFDKGLPESGSRTRAGFASFGGPHVLSMVTEVATRALKAVWRQKWLHHRRARPEVVAALLTLHENDPAAIRNDALRADIAKLRAKIPTKILTAVAERNKAIKLATPRITELGAASAEPGFPSIDPDLNYLLPMAFPEGSPTHPAYGAGHATVAGACVTVLKAFFEMFDDGRERLWPYTVAPNSDEQVIFEADASGGALQTVAGLEDITVQGELDKLAANISIARNMAGVHYSTDYYESLRLGERIAVSILEEHLSMYGEPVSMSFKSFDGEMIRVSSNGDEASTRVYNGKGPEQVDQWFARYAD